MSSDTSLRWAFLLWFLQALFLAAAGPALTFSGATPEQPLLTDGSQDTRETASVTSSGTLDGFNREHREPPQVQPPALSAATSTWSFGARGAHVSLVPFFSFDRHAASRRGADPRQARAPPHA